ncbi:hypothetical protein EV401DRAFT_1942206 [Pisolithus croceorrhizus]|nr:hypothetical protein EV401DRAFT_1942206 [Pisolithus croceorrhizus]
MRPPWVALTIFLSRIPYRISLLSTIMPLSKTGFAVFWSGAQQILMASCDSSARVSSDWGICMFILSQSKLAL